METKTKHSWNWNGGKTRSQHGYDLQYVGKDHPMADVRGYVYVHRLVASKKIGRFLRKEEIVHHINGNKRDNSPGNLAVVCNIGEHWFHHRRKDSGLRKPNEENPTIGCKCGCGATFTKYDSQGRSRKYIPGHNIFVEKRGFNQNGKN